MPFEYHAEMKNGEVRIKLQGEMSYDELRNTAQEMRKCADDHPKAIVMDLSGVTYLGEDGMALLLNMYWAASNRGIPIYAEGAKGKVAERMHRAGFDRVLQPPGGV